MTKVEVKGTLSIHVVSNQEVFDAYAAEQIDRKYTWYIW